MKETYEWIHSWCDEAGKHDLPRVLLVGDSITHSYQNEVRELLRGKVYVDYVATSYAIDTKMFERLIDAFYKDDKYDLVHFNNGLHGEFINTRTYAAKLKKIVGKMTNSKVVLVTSTVVNEGENKIRHPRWHKIVKARNAAVNAIAKEKGYAVDDLYTVSLGIKKEDRLADGTHYDKGGVKILAEAVAKNILENLRD